MFKTTAAAAAATMTIIRTAMQPICTSPVCVLRNRDFCSSFYNALGAARATGLLGLQLAGLPLGKCFKITQFLTCTLWSDAALSFIHTCYVLYTVTVTTITIIIMS